MRAEKVRKTASKAASETQRQTRLLTAAISHAISCLEEFDEDEARETIAVLRASQGKGPLMTTLLQRRHFEFIAATIKTAPIGPRERDRVAVHFASALGLANPLFQKGRFLEACGVHDAEPEQPPDWRLGWRERRRDP